jgi:signal transduction histidine kinase
MFHHNYVAAINAKEALFDITGDLIAFLRLKSKKVEIVSEEFNLNNVLNEISGIIATRFKGSSVELIFDIDNTVPRFMHGDSLHFGQILIGILENRLSTLSDEELRLEISMSNTYENKIELQFQFIDSGAGLTQEEVKKLFVPYYDEVKCQYVGLGLFVAQELVTMMNGELNIHSNIGKGTSFTLTLPFQIVNQNNRRKYRLPEKILTDKKVLVVDSHYNSALAIKKMFAEIDEIHG